MSPSRVKQGARVRTLKSVRKREAFWATTGRPGSTVVSLEPGASLEAAADDLGGNVMVRTSTAEGDVFVTLAEGEWAP
jgi:hypothetical protein